MSKENQRNAPSAILLGSLIIAVAIILTNFLPGWDDIPAIRQDPISRIEAALAKAARKSFPKLELHSIHVTHFEKPVVEGTLVVGIRIKWDSHTSTSTAMSLYPVSDSSYVGTFFPKDRTIERGMFGPLNVGVHLE